MGYNDLSDSGMSDSERRDEATRIVDMLGGYFAEMTRTELLFVERVGNNSMPISTKQLFWLHDIKDRLL